MYVLTRAEVGVNPARLGFRVHPNPNFRIERLLSTAARLQTCPAATK